MKAIVALFALVAVCQGGSVLLRAAPFSPLTYAHAPAVYAAPAPVVYSAPKLTNVEVPTPVLSKTNLHVLTDDDKISTTEVKPFAFNYGYAGYPHFVY